MQINILFFATLKDLTGTKRLSLELPNDTSTLATVRQILISRFPEVEANLTVALAAINEEYAFAHDTVKNGDEVFPTVAEVANCLKFIVCLMNR